MSANVERMVYVSNEENGRFVPWHGLGTAVDHAMTSAEALEMSGLDWNVDSKPIYTENGILIKGYKANTRNSDNKVLGIVTDKYKIVQNNEAFDFTDSLIGEGVSYETAGSLNGGKRIWLLAKLPERMILGDKVDNYVCFTNTHDGTGAIKVCCTPTRVVCNNTLNLALNNAQRKWSARHMGNIKSKLDEAKRALELADKYMDNLTEKAEEYANRPITEEQVNTIVNTMFSVSEDASDRQKENSKKAKEDFMVCYLAPDILKFMNTQWGLINAAADFADHRAPSRMTKNYQGNNWGKIMDGHPILDTVVSYCNSLNK